MRGVYTALITPFLADGAIDEPAFINLVRSQIDAGVAGLVICGTTAESPVLTTKEKRHLITLALAHTKGTPLRIVAGTGTNDTGESVEFSKWASDQGVAGVLVVTPYYNKPSQTGLESHYLAIADAVTCEVVLYNVPGRTGVSLTAATVAKLAAHPRIRSIKEATGNVEFSSAILDALDQAGAKMDLLSGDDATYLALLAIGAVGVISVASHLCPRAMVQIQRHVEGGDVPAAAKLNRRFYPIFRDLFVESNPVPLKFALHELGICRTTVRAPLAELSTASRETVSKALARCGISAGKLA